LSRRSRGNASPIALLKDHAMKLPLSALLATASLTLLGSVALAPATASAAVAYDVALTVTPPVAVLGAPRRITVSGNWADACPPSSAEIVGGDDAALQRLDIRVNEVQTFAPCAQVVTPFSFDLAYTPRRTGTLPILATTRSAVKLAEGRMLTVAADDAAAAVDLTGLWVDAPAPRSLLMVRQSASNPDALVGTWSVFDNDGSSRSLLFHSSLRTDVVSVYQAPLFSLAAPAGSACPSYGCPVTAFTTRQVGWVRIVVRSPQEMTVEAWMHGFPADVLAFRSELRRNDF